MCSAYSRNARVGENPIRDLHVLARGNTARRSSVWALVHYDEMTFFTHQVNGRTYGAWYRQLAPRELEIIGAGFLRKASYAGCDELSVARSVLEDFLRGQLQTGARPRPLDQCEQAGR